MNVQYQVMQPWCRAGRKKKEDMPDKRTVMMPPSRQFLFQNVAPHYEADPGLKRGVHSHSDWHCGAPARERSRAAH